MTGYVHVSFVTMLYSTLPRKIVEGLSIPRADAANNHNITTRGAIRIRTLTHTDM